MVSFQKKTINEAFIYSLFLLPLTGTGIPAYIVALGFLFWNIAKIKIKWEDVFFLSIIVGWFVCKFLQMDGYGATVLLRYYFGFYIFYLFFNNYKVDFNLQTILIIICCAVLIEAFLINTIIRPEWLLNYPKLEMGHMSEGNKILGFISGPIVLDQIQP